MMKIQLSMLQCFNWNTHLTELIVNTNQMLINTAHMAFKNH